MKISLLALLLMSSLIVCIQCTGSGSGDSAELIAFRAAVLVEINYARTDPVGYAESRLHSYNEAETDNGAYTDLKGRSGVGALVLNSALNSAATDYADYLANNNKWGHYEDGSPSDRCNRAGYGNCGENLAAGSYSYYNIDVSAQSAAEAFVRNLIIDEGVANLGHRLNILNSGYKSLGVGFGRDVSSTYDNYHVQNFGSN